jgi:signal transduction histidine kinase
MSEQLVPRFEKVHHRILEQINGMTSLMDDVLILGELNERSFTAELKSTDVVELCNTVIANYNDIQDDKRITVLKVVGEPVMVVLDEKLIGHAFSNLLSNAFKYSIGKQATMVSINFESNKVRISIKDDGIGIQEKDVKHLFEPFYRASNTLDISGTG